MRQMGGQDASFVYNEAPRMPMHIAGLAIYDPSTAKGDGHVQGHPRSHPGPDAARAHLLRAHGPGPVRLRPSLVDRRPGIRPRVPRPPHRPAQARRLASALHPGGPAARPPARP